MKAIWQNTVIAESNDTVEVEGNIYFPLSGLNRNFIIESPTRTTCPWKGEAHYYTLNVEGQTNADAAWYYPNPKPGAEKVADRVAFWHGVKIQA